MKEVFVIKNVKTGAYQLTNDKPHMHPIFWNANVEYATQYRTRDMAHRVIVRDLPVGYYQIENIIIKEK